MDNVRIPGDGNLDAASEDSLERFGKEYMGSKDNGLFRLAMYARYKARAMQLRGAGNVQGAFTVETLCDQIYRALPVELRW